MMMVSNLNMLQLSGLVFLLQISGAEASSTAASTSEIVHEVLGGMMLEVSFVVFFLLGFVVLRLDKALKSRRVQTTAANSVFTAKLKTLRADYSSALLSEVLKTWSEIQSGQFTERCPVDVLRMVMHAILAEAPDVTSSAEDLGKYLAHFGDAYRADSKHAGVVTGVMNQLLQVCVSRNSAATGQVYETLARATATAPNEETYEVLVSAFAQAGDASQVNSTLAEMVQTCKVISPRAHVLCVTGFVKAGAIDTALEYMQKMSAQGCWVPNHAMIELFRAAVAAGKAAEVLAAVAKIRPEVAVGAEVLSLILHHAAATGDCTLAEQVTALASERSIPLNYYSCDSLAKVYASEGSLRAIEYFDQMVSEFKVTEASCVSIVSLCAQSKFINLAEHVYRHCRESKTLSLPVAAALMKVYAHSKMYEKACELYDEIVAAGLEPDAQMNGCVIDFAVRAGRTDLSGKLFQNSSFPREIQSFMSQLRGCRRDHDYERALSLLSEMRAMGIADKAACNSALDVCIVANAMPQAERVLAEMKAAGQRDAVTYNTMIKGFCASRKIDQAMKMLDEMRADGCPPNVVSYNCILNVLVGSHSYEKAWSLVAQMREAGIPEDAFTLATLLKAVKACSSQAFAKDVLSLLDATQVDLTKDDVLLNVVLDVCVRLRDMRRLLIVIDKVKQSKVSMGVPTLNTMIKALSNLRRIKDVKELWYEMTTVREMVPNDISIGCMVDALVSNNMMSDAVSVVKTWKSRISMNCVIYSTLMKGFAIQRDTDGAFEVLDLMSEEKITPNLVTLNTLLDACARSGKMDKCAAVMQDIRDKHGLMPDRITYSTLIKGFCNHGDMTKALALMKSMKEQGLAPDAIIYNTVMDGCVGKDKFSLCDELYESMKKQGVKATDYTLTVLIKRFGRDAKLNKAFELVNSFPQAYNVRPSVAALTCLISACIANKDLERALRVFEKMKTDGPAPDAMTHEKLINALLRAGKVEKACRLVEDAYGLHGPLGRISSRVGTVCPSGTVTPGGTKARVSDLSTQVLENLVDQLARKGLVDSHAMPLVEKLRAAGVKVPQRLFALTLRGAMSETISAAPWSKRR